MAFYQATSGMWTPFQRIAYDPHVYKDDSFSILAPYTGTYLIATGLYAPSPGNQPLGTSVLRGTYVGPDSSPGSTIDTWVDMSGYCVKYAEEGKVLYSGTASQADGSESPRYAIYLLCPKRLVSTRVTYLGGCCRNSNYNPNYPRYSHVLVWKQNESDKDEEKWKVASSQQNIEELTGYLFDSINIEDPNTEYLISVIGGYEINGLITSGLISGLTRCNGETAIIAPTTTVEENKSYYYYEYTDRQIPGLVVGFYKFLNPVENLKVGLGVGNGMGHLFKVRI